MHRSIPESDIIELLQNYYEIEAKSVEPLPFGADRNALVYKAITKSNSNFVKIKYGNHEEIHIAILRLLHDLGIKEIIFPIAARDGNLIKKLDQSKIIVYPFIDGQNGFEKKLTKNQWIELGQTLKKIHAISVPASLRNQLRIELYSSKWRAAVKLLCVKIEAIQSDNKITQEFVNYFRANLDIINCLVNSAEKLSKKISSDSKQFVLCHADIHAGNVLLTSDKSFYIVDWDNPMMAPKERDLMFIGGGVGNVWNSPTETAYFYEGYGEIPIDKTILSYYRHERIIEDIAEFAEDLLTQNQNDKSKTISFKHFKSMFEPNGVIDIAFRN